MGQASDQIDPHDEEAYHKRTQDTEDIRAEIYQTRVEMSETIDAIQDYLRPERLKAEAQDKVREVATRRADEMAQHAKSRAKSMRSRMMDTVQRNPVPAILAGIGLGWLWMESKGSSDRYYDEFQYDYDYGYDYDPYSYGYERQPHGRMQTAIHETQERTRETMEDVSHRMDQVGHEARHRVDEITGEARQRVDQAQYRARRTQSQVRQRFYENPLALGALAVAMGTAIGIAVPETEREHRLMGEKRDEFLDRAQTMAEDTVERAKHVAKEAAESVKEEVQKEQDQAKQQTGHPSA